MITSLPIGIDLGATTSRLAWLPLDETDPVAATFGDADSLPTTVAYRPETAEVETGFDPASTGGRIDVHTLLPRLCAASLRGSLGPIAEGTDSVVAAYCRQLREHAAAAFAACGLPAGYLPERAVVATTSPSLTGARVLRSAMRRGGCRVLEFYPPALAAALAHGRASATSEGVVLVFSFGGGGCEACLARFSGGDLVPLGFARDGLLGGIEFDRRIAHHLLERLREAGHDCGPGRRTDADLHRLAQVVRTAEHAKIALSDQERVAIEFPEGFVDHANRSVPSDWFLDRAALGELGTDLIDRSMDLTRTALQRAMQKSGVGLDRVDEVVLCGGTTRIPLVRTKLEELLATASREIPVVVADEDAVAKGAAIRAAAHGFGVRDDRERAELWFSTGAVVRTDVVEIVGRAEPRKSDLSPESSLYVTDESGEFLDELEIGPNGEFEGELEPDEVAGALNLELLDDHGSRMAAVTRPVLRAAEAGAGVPRGITSTILPVDLAISAADWATPRLLLQAGSPLPAEARCTLRPGATSLDLIEGPRTVLTVDVADASELLVQCDERLEIAVRAARESDGGDAPICYPPEEDAPTENEVGSLLAQPTAAAAPRVRVAHVALREAFDFADAATAMLWMAELARDPADEPAPVDRAADPSISEATPAAIQLRTNEGGAL